MGRRVIDGCHEVIWARLDYFLEFTALGVQTAGPEGRLPCVFL